MLLAALILVAAPVSHAQSSDGKALKSPPATQEPKKKLTVDLGGGVTMEFILIRPGSFTMGSNKATHEVTLTKPFYLAVCRTSI